MAEDQAPPADRPSVDPSWEMARVRPNPSPPSSDSPVGPVVVDNANTNAASVDIAAGTPSSAAPGTQDVDLAAIRAVEPDFDETSFRIIARETFLKVSDARMTQRPELVAGLLGPALAADLASRVGWDETAHTRHIVVGPDIREARIVRAAVDNGIEQLDVRFDIVAEELDRSTTTLAIVAGDESYHEWVETWRFERRVGADADALDREQFIAGNPHWVFGHRGWTATSVDRHRPSAH